MQSLPNLKSNPRPRRKKYLPRANLLRDAFFILDPSGAHPRKQTLGLGALKPVRKVCPGRWLVAVPRARARSRASLTYLVPAAHKTPALPALSPARRPRFSGAWGAAVRARESRRRSAPVRAVPSRVRGARPPPPPPLPLPPRARLLWLPPAPSERCLRLRRPGSGSNAGTGGRGVGAGGRGGERGGAANGVPRLAPAAPPRVSAPAGSPRSPALCRVRPRVSGLRRALGGGAGWGGGQRVTAWWPRVRTAGARGARG